MKRLMIVLLAGILHSCGTQTTVVRWHMPDGKEGCAEIVTSKEVQPKGLLIREQQKNDGSKETALIIQTCHFPTETANEYAVVIDTKVKGIVDVKSEVKKEVKEILKDTEVSVTIARLIPSICEMLVNSGQEVNLKDIQEMLKGVLSSVKDAYGVEGELDRSPGKTPCSDVTGCESGQKCVSGYCQ